MQFQIEELGPARKQVRIEIPARTVDSTFATVYNQLAQTASLPGFRKGKVPISHVRKLYQDRARFSVTERLVDAGWRGLLDEHEVHDLATAQILDAEDFKEIGVKVGTRKKLLERLASSTSEA